ncbi:MAG: hypothetical protein ACLFVY_06805 [Phycisphaerae bacterium]
MSRKALSLTAVLAASAVALLALAGQPREETSAEQKNAGSPGESVLFDGDWEYHEDTGETFGKRGDGLEYGWAEEAKAGNADTPDAPGEKYDTYVAMPAGATWEIALPNGTYKVIVVAGDPENQDAHLHVLVEGVTALNQAVKGRKYWQAGHVKVTVDDGRLTLTGGKNARNNHLLNLHVYSPMYGHYPEPTQAKLPLKINCGGGVVDGWKADQKWTENADFGFIPITEEGKHRWRHDTPKQAVYGAWRTMDHHVVPAKVKDIPGTELDAIHRTMISQRGAKKGKPGPGFTYKVRLPKGKYDVTVLVTNMKEKRQNWTDFDLHVEDKVLPVRPGKMTDELYEAASATIRGVEVTDGIMNITPYFVGWGYSWGASISGLIIEEASESTGDQPNTTQADAE